MCFVLGVIIGLIIAFSTEGYLELLNTDSKILIKMINGTGGYSSVFWSRLLSIIVLMIIIFILNLHHISAYFSFILITYQSSLFIMTFVEILEVCGLSGLFGAIIVFLPINLVYLCLLIIFSAICYIRSSEAKQTKKISTGLRDSWFVLSISSLILFAVIFCFVVVCLFPLFLKSTVFLIF